MHKFSVLIPGYNCVKTLPNTLSSVLRQSLIPYEVILVDDCSVENVFEIYQNFYCLFKQRGISFIYHKNIKNMGVSYSRNLAWELSSGEYVCFLDSDDIWHENKLQVMDTAISEYNSDCIYHDYSEDPSNFHQVVGVVDYRVSRVNRFFLLLKNPSQTSCFVLRRSINDRFNVEMSYCEDYDLWIRVSLSSEIYHLIGKPLTLLSRPQKSPGGLSSQRGKMRLGEMRTYFNFSKCSPIFIPLLPLFLLYSCAKHVKSEISSFIKSFRK